jgi:hypothetical protein
MKSKSCLAALPLPYTLGMTPYNACRSMSALATECSAVGSCFKW